MKRMTCLLAASVAALVLGAFVASAETLKFTGSPHFLPAPVMVIGAYSPEGRANFAPVHRGGVLASATMPKEGEPGEPGTMRFAVTIKDITKSFTYDCVKASRACTVNFPSLKYLAETDLLGSFSGRPLAEGKPLLQANGGYQDKLAAAGLTAMKGEAVNAPMIKEFPVSLECELEEEVAFAPESKSRMLVLKVKKFWADSDYLDKDGNINVLADGPDSSLVFFSHSHAENAGYFGYGEFVGKSGDVSKRFQEKRE